MADIAVLDTDAIVLYTNRKPVETAERQRHELARDCIDRLRKEGVAFRIPTVVVAELCAGGRTDAEISKLMAHFANVRLLNFGVDEAYLAGPAIAKGLRGRSIGAVGLRAQMKFDALVAAGAHAIGARWIVTANPKDYAKHLGALGSSVSVFDVTAIPKGQLSFLHVAKR